MGYEKEVVQEITGKTYDECRQKIFKLYEHDYQIVNKTVDWRPSGFLHLQKKPVTVVKYVVNHPKSYNPESVITSYASIKNEEETLAKNREALLQTLQQTIPNAQVSQLTKIIEDFKTDITQKIDNISADGKPESLRKIEELLEANEFSFSFITMIEQKLKSEILTQDMENFDIVERRTIDFIGETIQVQKAKAVRPPHVFILIGPTGVGKTTTLVKLAVQFIQKFTEENNKQKPEICFINTDNMRVGATEQLERWGKHLHSPVYKVEKTNDLKQIYENVKNNVDAIFIDTSGFSPNDATHIAKMKLLLEVPGLNPDVYLTMTASTKTKDLLNIMQNYEPFGYKSVIITKCDESEQFGNVISALHEKHKSISFITNGQVAARDIEEANIVDFLIRLKDFRVDRIHIEDRFGEDR